MERVERQRALVERDRLLDLSRALAQQVGGSRRTAIVQHHVVGHDVDDLANLDALAIGVARNDL